MIQLIDTSRWIDFARGGESAEPEIASLLRERRAALCPPVWAELWGGVRGRREELFLSGLRESARWMTIDDQVWEIVAALNQRAIRSGLNCPFADILIVACARRHEAKLLYSDKHIEALLKL